jgi:glycerol-3-phosphate cytidylyltransferase
MNKIAIIGGGAFGTAMAQQLSLNLNNSITLFVRNEQQCAEINQKRSNKKYLPNFKLNSNINSVTDFKTLIKYDIVFLALPSSCVTIYENIFLNYLKKNCLVVNLTKGLLDKGITINDYFNLSLKIENFVSLKGPSFSVEVISNHPTLLTLGYNNYRQVEIIRQLFYGTNFYFDYTTDINGVEYLSALKNIYAIYMGNIDGKFNSNNSRYFILTQCFKEINILLKYLNCNTNTNNLGCGIGDLCLTSLSDLSRNRTLGLIIGKGFFNTGDSTNVVVLEGIKTLKLLKSILNPKLFSKLPILNSLSSFFNKNDNSSLNVDFEMLLRQKFKTVLTYGTFDLLHYGHLEILKKAKDYGDKLIVGLSSDKFNLLKGKVCEFDFDKRKEYLESLEFVDLVIPEESWEQKIGDIKRYNVDYFVMGDDWKGKFDYLAEFCEVIYLPRTKGVSTSQLKKLLNE